MAKKKEKDAPAGVMVKAVSGFMVDGEPVRAGELVELSEAEAKSMLRRGKAVVATAADEKTAAGKSGNGAGEGAGAGDKK